MKINQFFRGARAIALCFGLFSAGSGHTGPMSFSMVPAGSTAREPAPNVIVSVDDSGSMGPTGMATLREALTTTFGIGSNLADDRIRLAWQSMNRCPALGVSTAACGTYNGMRYLSGTHRNNFDAWARGLVEGGGTPSHLMISSAGDYLSTTGTYATFANPSINSPWAADPGVTQAPVLSCRKSFNIFMTDGGWNSGAQYTNEHVDTSGTSNGARIVRGGNSDGTTIALPNGSATYDTTSNQTRLYRDNFGGATTTSSGAATTLSTLSDLAFYYWSRDLQPALTNNVRASINRSSTESFVATNGATTIVDPFWNPRNNPATWQHMVNYTIGFNTASNWTGSPTWGGSTFAGDLPNLINGVATWSTPFCGAANAGTGNRPCDGAVGYTSASAVPVVDGRKMELWHAALNSRGIFVPAPNAAALVSAFQTILDDILTQTSRPLVSVATSSTRVSAGGFAYVAGYDSNANWSGNLAAFPINTTTSRPSASATWRAEALLDAATFSPANRVVLTHNGTQGRGFNWANLSSAQQLAIQGSNSVGTGTARISYLRGDRSLESGATGYMRPRSSRLGDIVNSNIWYTGKPTRMPIELSGHAGFRTTYASRTPTVYVGANDGMLHGFNALTGKEAIAYVPQGLYGTASSSPLRSLTTPGYTHRYYVDGHPFTSDVNVGGSGAVDWRTLLVGALGAGGKGYFILDVTNPANFVNPGSAASNIVMMDATATTDADIGHIFAAPIVDELTRSRSEQIVRVNDNTVAGGRWAVIMGNGYNSTNERPVLLIQYLDGLRELKTLVANATTGQSNGLGAPRTVDLNGDSIVDLVYAGDLKGNLWKFDLKSNNPSAWGVAFSGNPLFTALDSANNPQPITAAPFWRVGPSNLGGVQVLFGTGKNLTSSDLSAPTTQTVYSLWDDSKYSWSSSSPVTGTDGTRITASRASILVQQTQNTALPGSTYFSTSGNGVLYSRTNAAAKRGWYFDLPASGERVLNHPVVFDGEQILVTSLVPTSSAEGETCDLEAKRGTGFLNVFNLYSGKPPTTEVFGAGNGNRVIYGSGDYGLLNDLQKNTTTIFDPAVTCTGPNCPCVGTNCSCTGPDCPCTGPNCGSCGGLKGNFLEMCSQGVGGARSDWRELR